MATKKYLPAKDYKLPEDFPTGTTSGGKWEIERFAVDRNGAELANLQDLIHGQRGRMVIPGSYVRLVQGTGIFKNTVMSDTPAEIRDHYKFFRRVQEGDTVLLHGLGLGVALQGAFLQGAAHVTVIEISQELIDFVGPYWKNLFVHRLDIVCDDAYTWKPPVNSRWEVVWHDVWPTICGDHVRGMKKLHRRFGRRAGWQGSWCRKECERLR